MGAALTVAAVGAGVYFASSSRGGGESDAEKADRKKKKSKSSKKKKTVKDTDGPILEEIAPKVQEVPEGTCLNTHFSYNYHSRESSIDDTPLTEEQISSMSTEVSVHHLQPSTRSTFNPGSFKSCRYTQSKRQCCIPGKAILQGSGSV